MAEEKTIRIVLDKDELGDAQELARKTGINLQIEAEPQFLDPITIIVLTGAGITAAHFIVDLIEKRRGGLVIDLKPGAKNLVRRDRSVPFGWAVIRSADGVNVNIETHDAPKDASERLVGQIIDGVLKDSKAIAEAAVKLLGPGKVKVEAAAQPEG